MKRTQWLIVLTALALGVVGCGDDDVMTDGGMDAGRDGGGVDSGMDAGRDAQMMDDAGDDAGEDDAGTDDGGTDAGMDDGGTDAGMVIPDGLAEVRAATIGAHDPALEVRGVTVTYVRSAIGEDPAGFFVQAAPTGPAVFVTAAAGLDPVVAVGDVLDFDVTETANLTGVLHVSAATNFMRSATGTSVAGLVQDLSSAADLVSAVEDYVSELVTVEATITSHSPTSGPDHDAYGIDTAAITGNDGLQLRVAESLITSLGLGTTAAVGCEVTVGPSPLWRYQEDATDRAQLMGYDAADITVEECPALQVVGAMAVDPTTVQVTFSRPVAGAEAGDFTFTGGLTASVIAVSADGLTVTVTLTSGMMMDADYTVTVAGVTDAGDMDAIDDTADEAMFTGIGACPIATGLIINEVDYDNPLGSTADNAEYLELFNGSTSAIDLTGYSVVLVNGSNGSTYETISLSGSLPAGGYAVVGPPGFTVPGGTLFFAFGGATNRIQNGAPDAIAVLDGSNAVVDLFVYENGSDSFMATVGGASVEFVRGTHTSAADSNADEGSLSRVPNGCFSGNDATDWVFGPLTPGAAN